MRRRLSFLIPLSPFGFGVSRILCSFFYPSSVTPFQHPAIPRTAAIFGHWSVRQSNKKKKIKIYTFVFVEKKIKNTTKSKKFPTLPFSERATRAPWRQQPSPLKKSQQQQQKMADNIFFHRQLLSSQIDSEAYFLLSPKRWQHFSADNRRRVFQVQPIGIASLPNVYS